MVSASLKSKIAELGPEDRRQLIGYMVGLQIQENEAYLQTLTDRIDDRDPENWMTLDQLDAKLQRLDDE